jgi:hypothetical protein
LIYISVTEGFCFDVSASTHHARGGRGTGHPISRSTGLII